MEPTQQLDPMNQETDAIKTANVPYISGKIVGMPHKLNGILTEQDQFRPIIKIKIENGNDLEIDTELKTLIDTGATISNVSLRIASQLKCEVYGDEVFQMHMQDGSVIKSKVYKAYCQIPLLNNVWYLLSFIENKQLPSNDGIDIILGTLFLKQFEFCFNGRLNSFSLTSLI